MVPLRASTSARPSGCSVNTDPGRREFYQQALDAFAKVFEIADPATSRVEIPFEGTTLPAYFSNASKDGEPVPCVIMWNGLDSTKEHMYTSGWAQEMRERGVSVLMIDNPGSGEALRFQDLKSRIESEDWAKAQVDYLESRSDVDSDRIGLVGWSLGGYYVPRAAAYEKRIKFIAVWGANHNWGEVQKKRLQREGENPVPHYWEHVLWVWGYDDVDKFIEYAEGVNLNGVVDKITVPFLIAHGDNDRQISVDYAHQSYDQAVNSAQARAADLHRRGGRRRARRPRPHAAHQRVRRRLGRGHARRAGLICHDQGVIGRAGCGHTPATSSTSSCTSWCSTSPSSTCRAVISEGFTLTLLTALLLKIALELVLVLKGRVVARFKAAQTGAGKVGAGAAGVGGGGRQQAGRARAGRPRLRRPGEPGRRAGRVAQHQLGGQRDARLVVGRAWSRR